MAVSGYLLLNHDEMLHVFASKTLNNRAFNTKQSNIDSQLFKKLTDTCEERRYRVLLKVHQDHF